MRLRGEKYRTRQHFPSPSNINLEPFCHHHNCRRHDKRHIHIYFTVEEFIITLQKFLKTFWIWGGKIDWYLKNKFYISLLWRGGGKNKKKEKENKVKWGKCNHVATVTTNLLVSDKMLFESCSQIQTGNFLVHF